MGTCLQCLQQLGPDQRHCRAEGEVARYGSQGCPYGLQPLEGHPPCRDQFRFQAEVWMVQGHQEVRTHCYQDCWSRLPCLQLGPDQCRCQRVELVEKGYQHCQEVRTQLRLRWLKQATKLTTRPRPVPRRTE